MWEFCGGKFVSSLILNCFIYFSQKYILQLIFSIPSSRPEVISFQNHKLMPLRIFQLGNRGSICFHFCPWTTKILMWVNFKNSNFACSNFLVRKVVNKCFSVKINTFSKKIFYTHNTTPSYVHCYTIII